MHQWVSILGVRIHAVTLLQARDMMMHMVQSGLQHHVMTPNPEMLVVAHRDPHFRALLNSSSLNVPDGAGILWAARRQGEKLPERVTGIDLLSSVLALPEVPPVYLLGAAPGVAEKAADILRQRNPSLHIAGTYSGSPSAYEEKHITEQIHASGARILFVAYGAPHQDFWIQRNLPNMPLVCVAMGIGGAFDFLAGIRTRAPKTFQKLGLEWLWRLFQEPRRFKRILRAVVVFPILVLTQKSTP